MALAHVQRAVAFEGKAALGLVYLHRGDADIHHDAVDLRNTVGGEQAATMSEKQPARKTKRSGNSRGEAGSEIFDRQGRGQWHTPGNLRRTGWRGCSLPGRRWRRDTLPRRVAGGLARTSASMTGMCASACTAERQVRIVVGSQAGAAAMPMAAAQPGCTLAFCCAVAVSPGSDQSLLHVIIMISPNVFSYYVFDGAAFQASGNRPLRRDAGCCVGRGPFRAPWRHAR